MFFDVVNSCAVFVVSLAAAYFFLAVGLGVRTLRRSHIPLGFQASVGFGHPFEPLAGAEPASDRWKLYVLVPCLNEGAVIGETVEALVDPLRRARIVVVDDGSDDDTAKVARRAGGRQVTIVRRSGPDARKGKGAALNAGLAYVLHDVARRRYDPESVIVCVMDADGRLSDGAVDEVLPLFENDDVGGVQLAVRIRNRDDNFLLQFQDHQFWTLSSLTQFGRVDTGTVSLGGNGQFTRLAALLEVGERPWSGSLTEDLDLAISLGTRGWTLTSAPRAAVDQQGVSRLGPLVRQRTRWYQGHMMAIRRAPDVLRSPAMSHRASLEMILYLLVPWVLDLPWSILYHLILIEFALRIFQQQSLGDGLAMQAVSVVVIYVLGFWPALVTAAMAKAREPAMGWRHALKLGHAFVITNYLSYACAWRALFRIVRGRHGWEKTHRLAQPAPSLTALARRRVSADGRLSFASTQYRAGTKLAGETVEVLCDGPLVHIHHQGVRVATHPRRHQPAAEAAACRRGQQRLAA